jgi:hypothetical protein
MCTAKQKTVSTMVLFGIGMLVSCGLFENDLKPLVIRSVTPELLGYIDSTENYMSGLVEAGHVEGIATRGDTLLILGNGELYMALPGQPIKKVPGAVWESRDNGAVSFDSVCPGFGPAFIGDRDSLYISDANGLLWKINAIGEPIRYWHTNPNAGWRRAVWAGWLGGTAYKLLTNGWLIPGYGEVGETYEPNEQGANAWGIVGDSLYYSTYAKTQGSPLFSVDTLWAISVATKERVQIHSVFKNMRIKPCGMFVCSYSDEGFFKKGNTGWVSLAQSREAKNAVQEGQSFFSEDLLYNSMTIMSGDLGISILRNDSVFVRQVPRFPGPWASDSYSIVTWGDQLVMTGDGGAVYTLPLSEIINWD